MYAVSNTYKTKVKESSRTWDFRGTLTVDATTINLNGSNLKAGSTLLKESVTDSGKLSLGGAIMSDLSISLLNDDGTFDGLNLSGSVICPDVALELVAPVCQVETATVVGAITSSGNATVIVTSTGMAGSPKTISVPVLNGDTASVVAGKIRTALANDAVIIARFAVGGVSANIKLTRLSAVANDAALNISIDNGTCAGLIAATTSENTIAGVAQVFEWVPLGVFNVDISKKQPAAIQLQAIDNMVFFDRPFADISVTYPTTAVTLLTTICSQVGVSLATTSFLNDDYSIPTAPDGDYSCRDILCAIAQLAASWARCNRAGQTELVPIGNPAVDSVSASLTSADRYGLKVDELTTVTGLTLETDDTVYLSGTDTYTLDLGDNPLITHDIEDTLDSIMDELEGLSFAAYSAEFPGDPAIQAGDIISNTDTASVAHKSFVGTMTYKFRGKSTLACGTVSGISGKYKDPTQRALTALKRKTAEKQVQLDALNQAIINATNLIAGALGGYAIVGTGAYEGNYFVADNADITEAVKVWRWNIGGFGYSSTGVAGTYSTAITADGSIIAAMITADMIRTGMLQSLNGDSWLDMEDGTFNFGNGALTWDGDHLITTGDFISTSGDVKMVTFSNMFEYSSLGVDYDVYLQGNFWTDIDTDVELWRDDDRILDETYSRIYQFTVKEVGEPDYRQSIIETENDLFIDSTEDIYIDASTNIRGTAGYEINFDAGTNINLKATNRINLFINGTKKGFFSANGLYKMVGDVETQLFSW